MKINNGIMLGGETIKLRKKIDLNKDSKVLLFGCEGDANEELYQKLLAE